MDIKKRIEEILPYGMVLVMIYYGCPLFINNDTSTIIVMLAVMPAAVFLCSFFCGLKKGMSFLYLAFGALAFLPEYWITINDWAALGFYLLMYLAAEFFGLLLGFAVGKIVKKLLERA